MRVIRRQKWSSVTESAVSETVRRVNAKALALLNRRAEINRRIRSLHRVVEGLRDLGTKPACLPCSAEPAVPRPATRRPDSEHRQLRQPISSESAILDARSWRDDDVGRVRSRLSGPSKDLLAGLSRACRIALVEAESAASLDEIRSRIDRRGSFAFSDSEFADTEITRTLHIMSDTGEIRCLRIGTQVLWQRISPAAEIEN
jgi:hypothetical protein